MNKDIFMSGYFYAPYVPLVSTPTIYLNQQVLDDLKIWGYNKPLAPDEIHEMLETIKILKDSLLQSSLCSIEQKTYVLNVFHSDQMPKNKFNILYDLVKKLLKE
jgi:hypothetical protein